MTPTHPESELVALLACPFCGNQPKTGDATPNVPGMEDCGYFYIECCCIHLHSDESEEAAITAWNTRAAIGGLERIESAPFYWEQGGGVKQDAATGYCNGWNDCITAIEATRAATVPQGDTVDAKDAAQWRAFLEAVSAEQAVSLSEKFGDALGIVRDAARFRWLEKHAYIEFNGDDGNGWVCDASEPMFTPLRERIDATTPPPADLGRG